VEALREDSAAQHPILARGAAEDRSVARVLLTSLGVPDLVERKVGAPFRRVGTLRGARGLLQPLADGPQIPLQGDPTPAEGLTKSPNFLAPFLALSLRYMMLSAGHDLHRRLAS